MTSLDRMSSLISVAGILALCSLLAPGLLAVSAAQPADGTLADRIVAVVDEDPILWSDMSRVMALGLVERLVDEEDEPYQRRVLDDIIATKLRFHEVDRYGIQELPLSEVEAQVDEIKSRFPDRDSYETQLTHLGLTPDRLRDILARQLMVVSFVEERLGPRVFVSLDDIQRYYDDVLTAEMERQGEPLPELGKVREQIRAVLREQRLSDEISDWTAELWLRADVVDYLERQPRQLPPVVQ